MSASYKQPCREELERLVSEGDVEMAILATVDGLPITQAASSLEVGDAVSAMTASLVAIADTMAGQFDTDAGGCRQVIVESARRTIALIHAGENMVLAAVGEAGVNLGMLLSRARHSAEKIVDIVARSSDHAEVDQRQAPAGADLEELVRRVLQEAAQARGG
ncbi:MAG: roadblock/LC7 domain-containing protein [Mariprofundaceae bacterium]